MQLSCSINVFNYVGWEKDSCSVGTLVCRHLLLKMPAGADSPQVFCFSGWLFFVFFFLFDISCACGINKRATAVTVRCFVRRWGLKRQMGTFHCTAILQACRKRAYLFLFIMNTSCNQPINMLLWTQGLTTTGLRQCNAICEMQTWSSLSQRWATAVTWLDSRTWDLLDQQW